jgi:two-component system phosphate regulon sensor histidine kinase PhoR
MFLAYAGLVLLGIIAATASIAAWQEEQLVAQANLRLRDAGTLLRDNIASRLPAEPSEQLQDEISRLGKSLGMRLTIIDAAGQVLADSAEPSIAAVRAMENHSNRTEVMRAMRGGEATLRRNSPSTGEAYHYYATAIKSDDKAIGVVRIALSSTLMRQKISSMWRLVATIAIALGVLGLAITYWLTNRLVRPLNVLAEAAEGIAAGKYAQRIGVNSHDEFGMLARSFERMSSELETREAQLRESAQRQATVLGGMIEGVIAVDADQHVLFANVAAGTNLGFASDKVEGLPLLEVVRSHELRDIVEQSLEAAKPVRGEIAWQLRKKMLTLDVQATPLAGSPSPGVVLVLHDITELKRLEGMRQQFVANVSHELKTPLSSIKAYTETLLNGALEDPQHARHFLGRIDDQASRLHELIMDLLSLARIESGQATLEITNVPLKRVVAHCLQDQQERAKTSGLEIENQASETPLIVRADEESLLQILDNLIDNAIKYTPAGGLVTVRCRQDADQAVIEVSDTGAGIAPEHHSRLFERFYRADKARSRELGGTGLGLAIVKHLCQAMQGSVYVESKPGQGSTFGVRLPLVQNQ